MNSACGLLAVQQSEQRAEALAPEDQCGVGINADLDLVFGTLKDWRVRHELRILQRRMRLGFRCAHPASLWAAGQCEPAIHSRKGRLSGAIRSEQSNRALITVVLHSGAARYWIR